jgi:nucleoside phosphorylase
MCESKRSCTVGNHDNAALMAASPTSERETDDQIKLLDEESSLETMLLYEKDQHIDSALTVEEFATWLRPRDSLALAALFSITMTSLLRPTSRDRFEIAIICALRIERDAVEAPLDEEYEINGFSYGKAAKDPNAYNTGRLGNQHVVLAYMPEMGKASAAAVASNIHHSFPGIKIGLIVGICGGVPMTPGKKEEILLGDVIISTSVIQIDFGQQYPHGFVRKKNVEDTLGRNSPEIRSFVERISGYRARRRLKENTNTYSTQLFEQSEFMASSYPGAEKDKLYASRYRHKHQKLGTCSTCNRIKGEGDPVCDKVLEASCAELGCDELQLVRRERVQKAQGLLNFMETTF